MVEKGKLRHRSSEPPEAQPGLARAPPCLCPSCCRTLRARGSPWKARPRPQGTLPFLLTQQVRADELLSEARGHRRDCPLQMSTSPATPDRTWPPGACVPVRPQGTPASPAVLHALWAGQRNSPCTERRRKARTLTGQLPGLALRAGDARRPCGSRRELVSLCAASR